MKKLILFLFIPLVFSCIGNRDIQVEKKNDYQYLRFSQAKENNGPLDILNVNIKKLDSLEFIGNHRTTLKDKITVLMFLGDYPKAKLNEVLIIKKFIYDEFKNYENFQIVTIGGKYQMFGELKELLYQLEGVYSIELKNWYFANAEVDENEVNDIFNSLRSVQDLDSLNFINQFFIIDQLRNQRGRFNTTNTYSYYFRGQLLNSEDNKIINDINWLHSYNSIFIPEIRHKIISDIRTLLTGPGI